MEWLSAMMNVVHYGRANMSKICPRCGQEMMSSDGHNKCPKCGLYVGDWAYELAVKSFKNNNGDSAIGKAYGLDVEIETKKFPLDSVG